MNMVIENFELNQLNESLSSWVFLKGIPKPTSPPLMFLFLPKYQVEDYSYVVLESLK